ncbi:VIT1/CCC1 transporter family protein [Bacteroides stercorirosoris]|uniref:Predicted Fe2+/Mn2+ transporter, VIT1/CCC1 family n=1 Tax=Bacteroides stercorirosoris TaxID=871324 RepID=A0A1M6GSL6_9BACE|nr:VIT1/CCC1 transporter family protein [Bacteroides stercorirosoris]SHJ12920.1 Predicted Fe2+/Mn2+ transporter, VIT1/CCC1 family [Bacteroides stercorirosoris]
MRQETEQELLKKIIGFQREEITSCIIYKKLATIEKDPENRKILQRISEDESRHYATLRSYTHREVTPNRWEILFYVWLVRLLGITFAVRRLELGEKETTSVYSQYPDMEHFAEMAQDEQHHEEKLIGMISEERLEYMGAVVLGLNDALVEFTGALAGFTLALNDTKLIALTGSITGIAAALSMASSEYLSTKSEKTRNKRPVKAAIYTGIAYIITVVALVGPFILLSSPVMALCIMLLMALLIIAFFNYYYAIARNESFKRRFSEMAILSFSVAGISFLIGYLLKTVTGIEA